MSTRLKRKLADLGVNTSSNKANESFCLIGTPLPPLEKSKDTGEFVPLWKQDVRDEKGRRRLHGAFTGGFSAGYFNTVGSKEGWTPSTFVSSRGDRTKQKVARPEDFMDDEDIQDLKDNRKIVDTTEEMDFTGGPRGTEEVPEKDSISSALEASLLPTPADSVGARILKKMGWRMGQGIGPRVSLRKRKQQDMQLSFGGRMTSELANIADDDEEASKHTYAPRDTPILVVERKDNSHGLGYSPGMGLHQSIGGKRPAETSTGPKISAGFGLGALNDADDDDVDIYDGGHGSGHRRREAYDTAEREEEDTIMIGGKATRASKVPVRPVSSSAFFRDGQPVLTGFVLSDKPVAEDLWFPLPDIPKGWSPDPRRVWDKYKNKENIIEQQTSKKGPGGWDSRMSADERGAMLGETPLPAAPRSVFEYMSKKDRERIQNITTTHGSQPPSSYEPTATPPNESTKIPRTEPLVAQAALRGFQPFSTDPAKQARYHVYLQSQLGTDDAGPPLQPLPNQRRDELNKEMEDYAKAALLFKPMSAAMAGRFTSAAVVEQGPQVHVGLHTPTHEENAKKEEEERKKAEENISPKAHAAKMGMYGPLTRETKPWQPARLLCKRFKVKDPNPEPEEVAPTPAAPESNWQQSEIPMEPASGAGMEAVASGSGSRRDGPRDISNIGLGEDDDQGRDTLTYERPAMNIFKAIFASDSEDSDDEDEKKEEAQKPSQPMAAITSPIAIPAPVAVPPPAFTIPVETGPVDLNIFKPTFIPRDGKAKKDKDEDKDRGKEKKEKRSRDKKQRAALSFAIDEEGGETLEVKPSKDRPKKKRQRKEKQSRDDGDGMWVEKPAPEVVKDLVLHPPPVEVENSPGPDAGGPPRGRKRAVDFL